MATQPEATTGPQRTPWWFFPAIYLLGIAVLAMVARQVRGPLDIDGSYYLLVARSLAQGHGFAVDATWHFFHPSTTWPQPAGDLWMPLPSLLMAPALLFGSTFRTAQAAQVLLAAWLPLLAARIVRDHGAPLAWVSLAALATLLAGTVTPHWVDTDCFTAYALVGGAALYAMGRAGSDSRWWPAAGLLGGLGAVTRNDGLLLLAVLWLAAFLFRRRGSPLLWRHLLAATILFVLPCGLWAIRNTIVFGQTTPVSLSFFLSMRDYGQLFVYQPQPDWPSFWAQGLGALLSARLAALGAIGTVLVADLQAWALLPLLGALLTIRRRPALWPAFTFLGLLIIALAGAFPILVLHGSFSRSVSAFLPAGLAAAVLAIYDLVGWLLRRRPALPAGLVRNTVLVIAALAFALIGLVAMQAQLGNAGAHIRTWEPAGAWLQEHSALGDVVMAQDPMSVALYGHRRAIGIPNEGLARVIEIAHRYGVTRLVLVEGFSSQLQPDVREVYDAPAPPPPLTLLWSGSGVKVYGLEP